MDFSLSEEQTAIFDMARAFGAAQIAPFARAWEAEGTIPRALWAAAAGLGLGGVYVSETHGGSRLSRLDGTLVFEALAMACPSVSAFLSVALRLQQRQAAFLAWEQNPGRSTPGA